MNWTFLPELPEKNKEVLIAIKYNEIPIQGYFDGIKWMGSRETTDFMLDCHPEDRELASPEFIYAWAHLPTLPDIPEIG